MNNLILNSGLLVKCKAKLSDDHSQDGLGLFSLVSNDRSTQFLNSFIFCRLEGKAACGLHLTITAV